MSVPSSAIAQMLMQGSGGAQPQGAGGLQTSNAMETGADVIRKMMELGLQQEESSK